MRILRIDLLIATLALCVAGVSAGEEGRKSTAMGSGEMFDAIAPRYDLINNFLSLGMHRWWRSRMVAALDLQPGYILRTCIMDIKLHLIVAPLPGAHNHTHAHTHTPTQTHMHTNTHTCTFTNKHTNQTRTQ